MQLASLQPKQSHDDGNSMALLFCLEENNHLGLIEVSQCCNQDSLSVLVSIFFEFYYLLMQSFCSFLCGMKNTLSGSALSLMGFRVVM